MKQLPVGFVHSEAYLDHRTPDGHPERPDRLRHLIRHLQGTDLWKRMTIIDPRPAGPDHILQVHAPRHLDAVRDACAAGGGMLDSGDTFAVPESFDVAMIAAGGVVTAVDAVLSGALRGAFCAVRPPGHHAEVDRPMGFCLFNNVAIGARHAQTAHGLGRIAIVDWDVHHGNGTQHLFEDDPSVLFISLHQYPFWPGTGSREEMGKGKGRGFTVNIPLPAGTGEERYLEKFRTEVLPPLHLFEPDLLMISAGFDAHRDDPLGGMMLDHGSFGRFTRLLSGIAPIVSVLEGGYNLDALALSVEAHLNGLDAMEETAVPDV